MSEMYVNCKLLSKNDQRKNCSSFFKKCNIFSDLVKDNALMRELKAQKFDVGLAECIDPLAFATFHRLGIPTTVVTTSFGVISILGKFYGLPHPIGHPGFNNCLEFARINSKQNQF